MGLLFGLDCAHPDCVHDTARGYRLVLRVRRNVECWHCFRQGTPMPLERWVALGQREMTFPGDVFECPHCSQVWRNCWQMERPDLVFGKNNLVFALGQMADLGVKEPMVGVSIVEKHPSLPVGFDARLLHLREEPLPRTCLYFDWRPAAGEQLTPEKVFQCLFTPYMTAAERATAPRMSLPPDLFTQLMQVPREGEGFIGVSLICCQHCARPLPLRTFNTLTLRECAQGD